MHRSRPVGFAFRTWGGRRKGAGRKPKADRSGVPHRRRAALAPRYPVHVTVRVGQAYRGLRTKRRVQVIRQAFARCMREGFRVTDWSVQGDHVHLCVEARDERLLSTGLRSFSVRVAKGLNRELGRRGQVVADRYHARILRTPREVRNCLAYVLNNARHHARALSRHCSDTYSSGAAFDGWRGVVHHDHEVRAGPITTAEPHTWLRREGWRRCGLISVNEVPGLRGPAWVSLRA